jgi:hypothetical protein
MFHRPTKTPGAVAIASIDRLVREFLFEGCLDRLLEIGDCMTEHEVDELSEAVDEMEDAELRSWVAWLLQVGLLDGANLIRNHIL